MPEITTENNNSSSIVSSCNIATLQDDKDNDNAKCLDKSLLPTSPPLFPSADTNLTSASSSESNIKSDSSVVKQPFKQMDMTQENQGQSTQANESFYVINEQKPLQKLSEKKLDDLNTNPKSRIASDVNSICREDENVDFEQVKSYPLPTTKSSLSCTYNPSNPTELQSFPVLSTEEKFKSKTASLQSPCDPMSTNIFQQPSFSDLQDEYFHEMITRIGTDITSAVSVPDNTTPSVASDTKRKTCVTVPHTTQGADCISTTDNNKLFTQQLSPHEKSACSSTSSIATRPNTDNVSSMSMIVTKFGASSKKPNEYTGDDYKAGAGQFQNYPTGVSTDTNTKTNTLSPNIHDSKKETSGDRKDIKTFKSTAV